MKELLKKLRKYEIQIRKAINSQMQGDFHSIFKGSGLEFDDVRPYQYGDDIRTIDWNVTAKGHGTFVRTYKEEKEQTIFFILDVSASQDIGGPGKTKVDIGREICGVLALAGAKESSQLGLICFSDEREQFIKPAKGTAQAYQMIYSLAKLEPKSSRTNLNKAISFALNSIKRRSVIIMVSDFIDEGYQHSLKSREHHGSRDRELADFCRKHQINFLAIDTDENYVPKLLKLFKVRNKTVKSV